MTLQAPILTDRQRSALFDLPTDEASLLKHYTLADDDLELLDGCAHTNVCTASRPARPP